MGDLRETEIAANGSSSASSQGSALRRTVTGPLLFTFILGDVLGAGIYALMGVLSDEVGGALWVPLIVALGLALLTASSYAELVTKYPRAGGSSVFAQKAFGSPLIAFLVGFAMLAAGVVSAAGLALAFAGDYLRTLVDIPSVPAAMLFLILVAALNARGISESVRSNLVMTAVEVGGLLVVIVAGLIFVGRGDGDLLRVVDFPSQVNPATAVLGGAIIAYYSFVGFETSANVAEEVREPTRVYPRALFGALAAAGAVYVGVALISSWVLPPERLAASSGPLLEVVKAAGVGIPAWGFSLVALVAVANGALLTMIMASRMAYGMAEQRLLPGLLSRVLPRRRTPWVAIVATTVIAMALTIVNDLDTLASTVVLLLLFVFLSTNLAVLVLRRDRVGHRHFRTWTPLPILGIASCILLLTQQEPIVWLFGGIAVAVGVVLFLLTMIGSRSDTTASVDDG
ncbi:APC family permease [Microlunatus soli]|uniref:Amino acid transporter n=1 Tax=Microlunatus soli TaxID=630515 RepID=A0A1H1N6D1_9ACTN|nr:APC family permease [Microlunatus soli]SDR94524.1 Amino acid transporter [Microlunatus soli]